MKEKLYKALLARFEAQKFEAIATLEVYHNNPAGIGEHPQVVDEMAKQIGALEHAEGCISALKNWKEMYNR